MDPALAAEAAPSCPVFQDGLGERRLVVDPTGNETMEVLCLRNELTSVPSFEFALRERVSRLASFRHAYFGRVRSVDRLNDQRATLALVSDRTPGVRLSDLLAVAELAHLALDINAALCLIRQLVPAVATLHQNARDAAHGAIAPERIVIGPNARLVIVEHVMGAALEQLRFSHERYWKDLRIALPRSAGAARFDHRADLTQVGVVALSLILGRPLRDDEYPLQMAEAVASAWAISARGGLEPLPAGLRVWLAKTLQLDTRASFSSALEARDELDKVLGDSDYMAAPAAVETFMTEYQAAIAPPSSDFDEPPAPGIEAALRVEPVHQADPPALRVEAAPITVDAPVRRVEPPILRVEPAPIRVEPLVHKADPPAPKVPAAPIKVDQAIHKAEPSVLRVEPAPIREPLVHKVERSANRYEPPVYNADPPAYIVEPPAQKFAPPAHKFETTAHSFDPPAHEFEPPAYKFDPPAHRIEPPPALKPPAPPKPVRREPVRHETEPLYAPTPRQIFMQELGELPDDEEPVAAPRGTRPRSRLIAAAVALITLAGIGAFVLGMPSLTTASTGTLRVNTNLPGAQIAVDGEARGVTPATLTLKAGAHTLELRDHGEPRTIPITIAAGSDVSQYIELQKTIAPIVGQLFIRSEPAGASVSIDGVPRGAAPLTIPNLAAGEHTVAVDSDHGSVKQSVTIEPGITASLVVPLVAAEAAPVSGWISVSAPVDVQLYENKRLLGTSAGDRLVASAGRHEIEIISEPLAYRGTRTVQVVPGKVATIKIEFPKSMVALNAVPWAEVWIDGEKVGETPIGNLPVTIGPHEIVFRHPDLGEQKHAVTVKLDAPTRLSVDLRKK